MYLGTLVEVSAVSIGDFPVVESYEDSTKWCLRRASTSRPVAITSRVNVKA